MILYREELEFRCAGTSVALGALLAADHHVAPGQDLVILGCSVDRQWTRFAHGYDLLYTDASSQVACHTRPWTEGDEARPAGGNQLGSQELHSAANPVVISCHLSTRCAADKQRSNSVLCSTKGESEIQFLNRNQLSLIYLLKINKKCVTFNIM